VQAGGVTRAAEKLNRVQSNITTRVRQLEADLGVELFVRDGKKLHLSSAGRLLLDYADRLLDLAREAREAVHDAKPRGLLRLGSMESTASVRLPVPMNEYLLRYPEVTLELRIGTPRELAAAVREASLAYSGVDLVVNNAGLSISKPLTETTADDWDLQHRVMARGSFLVSREAARVMEAQGIGGDIVYIVSKNAVVAGANNVAYGAAKADQAHQVRLLAAELGPIGIRVNGVNPDGVVRGSGIFEGEWGDDRARVYGIARDDLGKYYAGRTVLGHEVLPEHVADAVFVFCAGDLSLTTGTIVPVDSGVPMSFLR
jgi:NAD(P)-dependent dehydrogenase (short-subunit alcohol dehydrogenase family)